MKRNKKLRYSGMGWDWGLALGQATGKGNGKVNIERLIDHTCTHFSEAKPKASRRVSEVNLVGIGTAAMGILHQHWSSIYPAPERLHA